MPGPPVLLQVEQMRYLFWSICGALFCYVLATKPSSAVGIGGELAVIAYGGVGGLGVAVATGRTLSWSLPFRLFVGIFWTIGMTALYSFVFGSLSRGLKNEVIFWGLIFGLPAPIICIVRGIPMLWASRRPGSDPNSK